MRYLFTLSLVLLSLFQPLSAEVQDPILTLPDGQIILSISATERREVSEDLLVATVSYKTTGLDVQKIQSEVNQNMKKALDRAKTEEDIKVSTGSYQVYEITDRRTKERKWQASQSLMLRSKNAQKILELIGELQEMKLNVTNLNYMVAPDTAVEVKDSLMESALKQLQTRANRAAKALGSSSAELRDVQVQSDNSILTRSTMPYAQQARARDMEYSAPPVAAAGETTITLTVSGRAILKRY